VVYNDFWVYNINTNHWFNWTTLLESGPRYPEGRYKGILANTGQEILIYSGSYSPTTNLSATENSIEKYLTYITNCDEILNTWGVSITQIGTPDFATKQSELYNITSSPCFSDNVTIPDLTGQVEFLQGVWIFNLNYCELNCSGNGVCEYGTCYCFYGYYGALCDLVMCPGSFCVYDNEFFTNAVCMECSGYGDCVNGTCKCVNGYSGDDCSIKSCVDDCSRNGDCVLMYPISQCNCFGKYGGDTCNVSLCLNQCNEPYGTCNLTSGECNCNPGYYGIDCSIIGFSSSVFIRISIWVGSLMLV
jgi:hypothetical protein